jgi:hypothetical protein
MAMQTPFSFHVWPADKGVAVIYNHPASGAPVTTDADFDVYKAMFDPYRSKPWIWVINCAEMTAADIPSMAILQRTVEVIQEEHGDSLQRMIFLNINPWVSMALSLFTWTPAFAKILVGSADRLELLGQLDGYGFAFVNRCLGLLE